MSDRTEEDRVDAALEAAFSAARAEASREAPKALLARIEADAMRELPAGRQKQARPRRGFRAFLAAIGGPPALGGLVTAAIAGLWIGLESPSVIEATPWLIGDDLTEFANFLPEDYIEGWGEG